MSQHIKKATLMMMAARPASGFRPETGQEWDRLQKATTQLGYAMLRTSGANHADATAFLEIVFGGSAGRLLMEIGMKEDTDV